MGQLRHAIGQIETYLAALDPNRLDGPTAIALVELFDKGQRLCTAGRALAAARVDDTGAWKPGGYRSATEWLATTTKTSRPTAASTLHTAHRLTDLPTTRTALIRGDVSTEQAAAITTAAAIDPGSEASLLAQADTSSLKRLEKASRAVVAAATANQRSTREEIHRTRYLRTWTATDGALHGSFRLTPDHGALVLAALDIEHRDIFDQARQTGTYETADAYQADALVNLARTTIDQTREQSDNPGEDTDFATGRGLDESGADREARRQAASPTGAPSLPGLDTSPTPTANGTKPGNLTNPPPAANPPGDQPYGPPRARSRKRVPKAEILVRVDYQALRRGHTLPGETCEIDRTGPISVDTARCMMDDAIIKLVDARTNHTHHAGRTIPTPVATALKARDTTCTVPGCDTTRHLEIHHLRPYALGGPTTLDNLARVCPHHHDQITHQGAKLTGAPGHWTWQPPRIPKPEPVRR